MILAPLFTRLHIASILTICMFAMTFPQVLLTSSRKLEILFKHFFHQILCTLNQIPQAAVNFVEDLFSASV